MDVINRKEIKNKEATICCKRKRLNSVEHETCGIIFVRAEKKCKT